MTPLWNEDIRPFTMDDLNEALGVGKKKGAQAACESLLQNLFANQMPWSEMVGLVNTFLLGIEPLVGASRASLLDQWQRSLEGFARKQLPRGAKKVLEILNTCEGSLMLLDPESVRRTLWYLAVMGLRTNVKELRPHAERIWKIVTEDAMGESSFGFLVIRSEPGSCSNQQTWTISCRNSEKPDAQSYS